MILQVDHLLDQNSKAMVAAVEGHAGERARFVWWPGRRKLRVGFVRGICRGITFGLIFMINVGKYTIHGCYG